MPLNKTNFLHPDQAFQDPTMPNSDSSSIDQEVKNQATSYSNKFSKFIRLLRGSHMSGLKNSDVYKVVKMIEQENLPMGLSNMSKDSFFERVKWIIEHNILKRNPFCSFCLKSFHNRKDRDNHINFIHKNRKNQKLCCTVCNKTRSLLSII